MPPYDACREWVPFQRSSPSQSCADVVMRFGSKTMVLFIDFAERGKEN
jgi:hypothetical protein